MLSAEKKIGRMVEVAQMYYEQDKSQSEIAKEMGISRPLVSLLLAEAKEKGIVQIKINDFQTNHESLSKRLREHFWLDNVLIVTNSESLGVSIDDAIAARAYAECFKKNNLGKAVGIGWGSILGRMADYASTLECARPGRGLAFPLAGGISSVIKGYHINELVRVFSLTTGKTPAFLYIPALFDTEEEMKLTMRTEPYIVIKSEWETMEQALVSISNYPSYPDLGVNSIYGNRLTKEHAVGRILAYYFNAEGQIIHPVLNTTLQVPFETLRKTDVIAVCAGSVKKEALLGALRLRIINTLVVTFELANSLLDDI